ncbi:hypothetical protein E2C01_062512 [Portunus trituberculatus]|uniref:Uncharacterized protein n=1 Tax=Portunus trituberculatus TaxID=210409 RepID=A0A5B7HDW0_PORTR|nr:hypothetical protein [Portunus trituberculatus]
MSEPGRRGVASFTAEDSRDATRNTRSLAPPSSPGNHHETLGSGNEARGAVLTPSFFITSLFFSLSGNTRCDGGQHHSHYCGVVAGGTVT